MGKEETAGHKELFSRHNLKNLVNEGDGNGEVSGIFPKFLP